MYVVALVSISVRSCGGIEYRPINSINVAIMVRRGPLEAPSFPTRPLTGVEAIIVSLGYRIHDLEVCKS